MMLVENFNKTIDHWITELDEYSFHQLCRKPSPTTWSLGQLCIHLIDDGNFYIEQIKICLTNNDHAADEASPVARAMFFQNDFPNEALKGSPDNDRIPQPRDKELIMAGLLALKAEINNVTGMLLKSPYNGKTKHPGLGYFSGRQWLQFADMHFRHHLRQKKRIDAFLNQAANKV